jgi:DNA repair protein RecN (Recombination protein N)
MLADLAMDRTRFDVRFNGVEPGPEEWSERGIDRAEFYVSPNPGEELRPLARIVSGGELSRVMLALKTLTLHEAATASPSSKNDSRPHLTLIFDEVDAGIGGRVAEVVGSRLRALGDRFQVLCITHLAPIAARGTTHFRIEKTVRGQRTVTSVERLTGNERVDEIGRMIGGAVLTDAVRATARDLIGASEKQEPPYVQLDQRAGAKGESESPRRKRKS